MARPFAVPGRAFARSLLLLVAPASLKAQRIAADVAYVTPGVAAQRLDLYLPATHGFPTLVIVHGGSLVGEDKRDDSIPGVCTTVMRAGVGCVSVNYRLGPSPRWPAQPEDVAAAFGWVRRHIAEYGGDPARLVLLGHSSGCQLVSVISTDPRYLAGQQLELSSVRGVAAMGCLLSPVPPAITDSARLRAVFTSGDLRTFGSLETFLEADPTAHVGPGTPPFLVLVAEGEQVHPPILEHAQRFAERMRGAGRTVEIDVLPGREHYTALEMMVAPTDPTLILLLAFIHRTTGGP